MSLRKCAISETGLLSPICCLLAVTVLNKSRYGMKPVIAHALSSIYSVSKQLGGGEGREAVREREGGFTSSTHTVMLV